MNDFVMILVLTLAIFVTIVGGIWLTVGIAHVVGALWRGRR